MRSDAERLRAAYKETRPADRLRAHFEVERELAARLSASPPEERGAIYGRLYEQLFASVPDHPQHNADPARRRHDAAVQINFLRRFADPPATFVEMGCGDAAVAQGLAGDFALVTGVDVTSALIEQGQAPGNFRFAAANGAMIGLPDATADLVYSNQLMEHLHPDDAAAQLREILRILKPGGRYICITPNRLSGPHDISVYFGYEPQGFHLREYDYRSLSALFRATGFVSLQAHARIKGRDLFLPIAMPIAGERILAVLPRAWRTRATLIGPVRNLLGLGLIGRKPA